MPERARTISPKQHAFRETFLWRFHRPGLPEVFRTVGDALVDLMNEGGEWGPAEAEGSLSVKELRAVLRDLEHLLDYLEEIEEDFRSSDPDDPEGLTALVGGWIGRLARIVVDMRRQIDLPPEGA